MTGKMLSKDTLLDQLAKQVSDSERAALEDHGSGLVISKYNRETVLRMLSLRESQPVRERSLKEGVIDASRVESLAGALKAYLDLYMSEQPEGHKWIILCCLFLTFIAGEPMHPQEVAHWERMGDVFRCPCSEMHEGSICQWCACNA